MLQATWSEASYFISAYTTFRKLFYWRIQVTVCLYTTGLLLPVCFDINVDGEDRSPGILNTRIDMEYVNVLITEACCSGVVQSEH